MCSRDSCSIVPSRFLAGLLIFLAAFLAGTLTAETTSWFTGMTILRTQDAQPRTVANGCESPDRLQLSIWYDAASAHALGEPHLSITNNGSEPIYYIPYDLWVRNPSRFEYPAVSGRHSCPFQEIELAPGETNSFPLDQDASVEAILRYRTGEARTFHSITAHFTGSVPDRCR